MLLLLIAGLVLGSNWLYFVGVVLVALLLAYEQSLVSLGDLSKLNLAFFTMNGVIAIVFGIFVVIGEII
jgi:4-hydroxybenzoate polyprenyltransferase